MAPLDDRCHLSSFTQIGATDQKAESTRTLDAVTARPVPGGGPARSTPSTSNPRPRPEVTARWPGPRLGSDGRSASAGRVGAGRPSGLIGEIWAPAQVAALQSPPGAEREGVSVADYKFIKYETTDDGRIARIILNRPKSRNAQHRGLLV